MKTFADVLKFLFSAYPHVPISEDTVEVYYEFLYQIPAVEFELAVRECIRTCPGFPSIAHILEAWRNQNGVNHGADVFDPDSTF